MNLWLSNANKNCLKSRPTWIEVIPIIMYWYINNYEMKKMLFLFIYLYIFINSIDIFPKKEKHYWWLYNAFTCASFFFWLNEKKLLKQLYKFKIWDLSEKKKRKEEETNSSIFYLSNFLASWGNSWGGRIFILCSTDIVNRKGAKIQNYFARRSCWQTRAIDLLPR